jgi:zinc transporter, ZIP family
MLLNKRMKIMEHLLTVGMYSLVSGITILIGGIISRLDSFPESEAKENILHSIIAFGGGVLIAAVAFVLTPRAIELLSMAYMILFFLLGAYVFFLIDRKISRSGKPVAQLMAMLMDFIPEAIALGAVFAHDKNLGLLLAIFIGLQNLPEGFNSFKELVNKGFTPNKALLILLPLSFIGVLASCLGFIFLHNQPTVIASLMLFAGGGIIYLTFQDIAPMSAMKNHWSPALGASAGFLIGMVGQKLLG